jgi:hypothetical protein
MSLQEYFPCSSLVDVSRFQNINDFICHFAFVRVVNVQAKELSHTLGVENGSINNN